MGDRVEERREEQRILDARLERNRVELKRQDDTKAFSKVVANMQKTGKESASQNGNRQKATAQASTRLMARRGISNNDYSQQLLGTGGQRNCATREKQMDKEAEMGELGARRQMLEEQKADKNNRGGIMRDPNPKQQKESDSKKSTSREAHENRREQVLAGAAGAATLQALLGVSPKQSSGGATGVHANVQKMIDEIVSKVHSGLAANDKPVVHIELKEHILAGSNLTIMRSSDGVSLKIQSPNEEVSRLFSSGETARELSQALKRGGVNLSSFEVNNVKVLG